MNVKICDIETMKVLLQDSYVDADIVSIRDTDGKLAKAYSLIDKNTYNCASLFHLYFDDIWAPEHLKYGYKLARPGQLKALIKWSENKPNIIVHCTSGISRSSAIAYLLLCNAVGPTEAIKQLDPFIHYPNPFIVKLGALVLENPNVELLWSKTFKMQDIRQDPCKNIRELKEFSIKR